LDLLRNSTYLAVICACGLLLYVLAAVYWQQADIRVALGFAFSLLCTHSRLHLIQAEIACHRGGV
jgi:hypothetical protein